MSILILFLILANLNIFVANLSNLLPFPRDAILDGMSQVINILEKTQNCKCSIATIGSWNNTAYPNSGLTPISSTPFIQTIFDSRPSLNFMSSYSFLSRHSSNLCSIILYLSPNSVLSASVLFSRTKLSLSIAKRSYHIVLCNPCGLIYKHFTKSGSILPELFGRHLFLNDFQFLRMDPGNTELLPVLDLSEDRTDFEGRHLIFGSSRPGRNTGRRRY